MVQAIVRELELRQDYLENQPLDSIYFGGGTPSLLHASELNALFDGIYRLHRVAPDAEITLEANPDDLTLDKLLFLRNHTPVNRLSIGIQSFFEEDLLWMNRAHNAHDARACLESALSAGFQNLTIDLIYGAPTTPDERWAMNLEIAFGYHIPHLSCYALTVEAGTALYQFIQKGKQAPVNEEQAARQFRYLMESTVKRGYEQYEISNFALPGRYARHNTSYWTGQHYLGAGPAAHSFNGYSRQWNIANNALYIKSLSNNEIPFEREILTPAQQFNEYIMTALRTMWGIDMEKIAASWPHALYELRQNMAPYLTDGSLLHTDNRLVLSQPGKLLADRIASDLFILE